MFVGNYRLCKCVVNELFFYRMLNFLLYVVVYFEEFVVNLVYFLFCVLKILRKKKIFEYF